MNTLATAGKKEWNIPKPLNAPYCAGARDRAFELFATLLPDLMKERMDENIEAHIGQQGDEEDSLAADIVA